MSVVDEIRSLLGADAVLTSQADLAPHVEDWRGRDRGPAACVALPSTTAQVAAVVRAAVRAGVPVLPQGGNTSLCAGAIPDPRSAPPVIVSLARMRRVRAVDAANNSMEVEAGCVLAAVQQAAVAAGRLYPVSLGAEGSCQIGGNIATNAGGTGVLRYGNTRDNVLGLEVVLPDGQVWDGLYKLRKNNTGIDLKHLFIGAEGTLGIVTAAVLKLHPLPTAQAMAWVAVRDPDAAIDLLGRFQQRAGGVLSAYEMLNDVQLRHVVEHVAARRPPLPIARPWHVLVELADTGPESALTQALEEVLADAAEAGLVEDAVIASNGAQRAALWEVRHSVSEGNRKAGIGINTDCAVPISAVPRFIAEATAASLALLPGARIVIVAHLGDGNVHFIPFLSFEQWRALADPEHTAHAVKHAVNEVAHRLGGTFSAEHGIGRALTDEMALFKPQVELDLMRGIKRLLDPADLFNPHRLLPAVSSSTPPASFKESA